MTIKLSKELTALMKGANTQEERDVLDKTDWTKENLIEYIQKVIKA